MPPPPPPQAESALVVSPRKFFALASRTYNASFSLNGNYKSKGADPFISRALDKSLIGVSQGVAQAKSSFASVDKILNEPKLQICRDVQGSESLVTDWGKLKSVSISLAD